MGIVCARQWASGQTVAETSFIQLGTSSPDESRFSGRNVGQWSYAIGPRRQDIGGATEKKS